MSGKFSIDIQSWHDGVDLCMAYYAHARFDDLDLDARPLWLGRGNSLALNYLANYKQTISMFG